MPNGHLASELRFDSFMRAVEFHSIVENGHIAVPKTFHLTDGLSVRVLILLDEASEGKEVIDADAKNVWERTAGA